MQRLGSKDVRPVPGPVAHGEKNWCALDTAARLLKRVAVESW
jgi:hypothetical protein